MLISSMDQLNYHSMPKESYLEIDTSFNGYSMGQQSLGGLVSEEGSPTYMNEENSPKNGTKSSLYKTELCKRFSEFGSCRYGAKCQFAHGIGELRHVIRHPKYKTTKCKSYWGSGHCPYGSRCRFIHEETEGVVPPFSPPGAMNGMGGMFFQENTTNDMLGGSSPSGSNNYLYGSVANGNSNSYQKDYSLLSSFNQDAVAAMPWGSAPARPQQSPLGYANTGVSVAPPAPVGVNRGAGYSGLQDAIDALMRFSLSPAEAEAQLRASGVIGPAPIATSGPTPVATPTAASSGGAPLGTITTTPVESRSASAGANGASASSANQDTSADELWNDFPSLSTTSSVGGFGKKQWPTGLSLSLEGTGLFTSSNSTATTTSPSETNANTVDTTTTSQPTTPSEKDETSPRLSVFERFHSRS